MKFIFLQKAMSFSLKLGIHKCLNSNYTFAENTIMMYKLLQSLFYFEFDAFDLTL